MLYKSTRNGELRLESHQAILQGISEDGGLFVPQETPLLGDLASYLSLDYRGRAKLVLSKFLTDFTKEELDACVDGAYTCEKFGSDETAPLKTLDQNCSVLELWHGPTCAFKDMALQILPRLLTVSMKKSGNKDKVLILVATSGDTGKAALEGFRDVEDTKILVFYPSEGVSPLQKLQMMTQEGVNVGVCGIRGNFDDAQTGVKRIFGDAGMMDAVAQAGYRFSSANSINWGRLVPQIVYYVSAYCDLVNRGVVRCGDPINICVPTGNFGNILAAYYAKRMGLPVSRLICASNANNVLTDFLETGTYDRNREFHTTISPSMDILISSNLERLLFDLSLHDAEYIRTLFDQLAKEGKYTVKREMFEKLTQIFSAGYCDDDATRETIRAVFEKYHYTMDPHTAVAMHVYQRYYESTCDFTHTVIASTASPYKFPQSVLEALGKLEEGMDDFALLDRLAEISEMPVPAQLAGLRGKAVRFGEVCGAQEMPQAVLRMVGGK